MEITIREQAKERFVAATKLTDFNPDFVRKVCGPLTKKLSE